MLSIIHSRLRKDHASVNLKESVPSPEELRHENEAGLNQTKDDEDVLDVSRERSGSKLAKLADTLRRMTSGTSMR